MPPTALTPRVTLRRVLPTRGRAEQENVLGPLDEARAGQLADLLALDRGARSVELVQALDPGQPPA